MVNKFPFSTASKPRIIGHRGAAGEAPENTLSSFQKAFGDGAAIVEMDVRGTKDGEVVIIHDATLNRTTNGRGRVSQRTLREIKALDAGYRFTPDGGISYPFRERNIEIPTLEEFLSSLPEARAIVEIKPGLPPITKKVLELIHRLGKENQVLLATEDDRIMSDIRKEIEAARLTVATGFSYGEVAAFIRWVGGGRATDFTPRGQAMQIPCEYRGTTLVSEATVRAAHGLEIGMFVWTINDPDEMGRLLRLGVDGIITDYPARLRGLIRSDRP
ncbi:MAG: glycerophosphodiester phosphodiesterase [Deltaproteobacteria bacterium]|nr:glycerophosphodiester phosphodiesterase [Deltaproteobacteria bacterium]